MCFSAQASFTAGAVLLIVGAATVRRARVRSELSYAWIPVLFGIQQLLEGALWLTFPDRAPLLNTVLTHAYSFFSHVLWPIYVPLAGLALEPVPWRRRVLIGIALAGSAVGAVPAGHTVHAADRGHRDRPAHRLRIASLLCTGRDVTLPVGHLREPDVLQPRAGRCLRCGRVRVVGGGLCLLCHLVHLGVVLLRRGAQRHRVPVLHESAAERAGPRSDTELGGALMDGTRGYTPVPGQSVQDVGCSTDTLAIAAQRRRPGIQVSGARRRPGGSRHCSAQSTRGRPRQPGDHLKNHCSCN